MIRTLRAYFLRRLLREKLLLVALAAIVVVLWASNEGGRLAHFWTEQRHTTFALAQQRRWLASRQRVQSAARLVASRFDPAKTVDGTHLLAAVAAMANDAGLKNYTSGEPQDVSNGQFAVHTLQFTMNRVDWGTLNLFYAALQKRAPYIGIEQFSVVADRANPILLNVFLKVSSVEISASR